MPKTPTHVRVRHADGRVWDCPTRALPHWREKGWTPIDETKAPAGKKAAAKKAAAKKTTTGRRRAAKKTTAKKAASSNTSSKPAGD